MNELWWKIIFAILNIAILVILVIEVIAFFMMIGGKTL